MGWSGLIDGVHVVQHRVERLDPRNRDIDFLSKLNWRPKICLDFHRSSGLEVLIHNAGGVIGQNHLFHYLFSEARLELAALSFGDGEELINDTSNHRKDTNFFEKLGV